MKRYIDADKLKAEIKRQKRELELSIQSQGDYGQSCHIVAYENILSLIDSLQQEQPEVELEKASRNVYESWKGDTLDDFIRDMVELGKVLNARKEE